MRALLLAPGLLLLASCGAAAEEVLTLTTQIFDQHINDNRQTLVEFYAPWCGHCKKLTPEYEKAAVRLKSKGVKLCKVDATEEKELATRYSIKGFPTLVWFQDGKNVDYDGGRTADTIVEWVDSMTGPAVLTEASLSSVKQLSDKPTMVLSADSLLAGFEETAQKFRRKAAWYFVKASGSPKVTLMHKGEEPIELTAGAGEVEKVSAFLTDNALPLFGRLDGDTFDKYMDAGKGLVWSLFPNPEEGFDAVEAKYRPVMSEVAKKFRGKYFVTLTDTDKFKEAIDNMLSIAEFPAIAVQKKAGDKRKFVYSGEMTAQKISAFIDDVEAGRASPRLKSEQAPTPNDDPVKVVVGSTMEKDIFTDRDVLLEVYAPWCGHCKKLEPEYIKLAKKIKKEELTDLVTIAKMDGTANDSPIDSIDWTGFPSIFFIKAGTREAITYDGERTAKGLWKYIKKSASKAQEIRERMERRKGGSKRAEEL